MLSYPFPSILCHNKENIYLLSINGEKIKYQKLKNNEKILIFIDKNLGLLPDRIDIVNRVLKDLDPPLIQEVKYEITKEIDNNPNLINLNKN